MKRYAIVIEDAGTNLAAYLQNLPGCVVIGEFVREAERLILEHRKDAASGQCCSAGSRSRGICREIWNRRTTTPHCLVRGYRRPDRWWAELRVPNC
jgi:hypothetical protein